MVRARLMDKPEDFQNLGINPDKVELWEGGRRNSDAIGNNEVWYFDGNFDDGSKVVIGFRPKTVAGMRETGWTPNLNLAITRPDGTTTQDFTFYDGNDCQMSTEKTDVTYGSDYCRGDFKDYDIHIESTESLACDLHYHAVVEPFRQGTSVIALGDNDEYYYTDLCVPRCEITGSLTYDGKTVNVHGYGYHDHQWFNISLFEAFHHWLWGRMYTEKYTLYIYDFVCSERFDFAKVPFFIVADNETGKIIFETNGNFSRQTELEMMSVGKAFPKTSHYTFDNGDEKVTFNVTWQQILETRDSYGIAPANQAELEKIAKERGLSDMQKVVSTTKEQYDAMGIQPTYMRFFAEGEIAVTKDGVTTTSKGDMIYEYNYVGKPDKRAEV